MACFPIYTTFYGDCRLEGLQIYLKRSLVAVDQKQDRTSFVFLITLSFKGNCSPCFRPKVDPVMEEVLEAFAVSVKFFRPYLMLCVKLLILKAQRANGVLRLISPTCPPHPSIFRAESFLSGDFVWSSFTVVLEIY